MQKISIQKLKWVKSLYTKKNRDKEGLFIVEGEKSCSETIRTSPGSIRSIICSPNFQDQIPETLSSVSYNASTDQLNRISSLKTPNKVLIVRNKMENRNFDEEAKCILLEHIQDPGNLGTILRTADWFGIKQVICSPACVDIYNNKTIQASMGSYMRINVIYTELLPFIEKFKLKIAGATLNGKPLEPDMLKNVDGILLGNESKGISGELEKKIEFPVRIDGHGNAESLNVSIAAAIFMHEWSK